MQRLAALVPRPRLHLIRFHGVLAPHAKSRAAIVPRPAPPARNPCAEHAHHAHRSSARMSWARLREARIQYRPRTLPELRRRPEDHRRHRRSAGDRQDPHASQLARARAAALAGAPSLSLPGGLSIRHRFTRSAVARARPAPSVRLKRGEIVCSRSCGWGNFQQRLGCLTAWQRSGTVVFGKKGRLKCLSAGYEVDQWYGIITSAKVPRPLVDKLALAIAEAVKSPETAQRLSGEGSIPVGSTPDQFSAHIRSEIAKWRKLAKEAALVLH